MPNPQLDHKYVDGIMRATRSPDGGSTTEHLLATICHLLIDDAVRTKKQRIIMNEIINKYTSRLDQLFPDLRS